MTTRNELGVTEHGYVRPYEVNSVLLVNEFNRVLDTFSNEHGNDRKGVVLCAPSETLLVVLFRLSKKRLWERRRYGQVNLTGTVERQNFAGCLTPEPLYKDMLLRLPEGTEASLFSYDSHHAEQFVEELKVMSQLPVALALDGLERTLGDLPTRH